MASSTATIGASTTANTSKGSTQTYLITGATGGLGHAVAIAALKAGNRVIATGRNPSASSNAARLQQVEQLGGVWEALDVASDELEARLDVIVEKRGEVDVLVNCAGFAIAGGLEDTSLALAHSVFNTNFWGTIRTTKHLLPSMRRRAHGTIINVTSSEHYAPHPSLSFYAATKAAVSTFTETLRSDLTGMGIRVLLAEPGGIRTGFNDAGVLAPLSAPYKGSMVDLVLQALMANSGKQGGDAVRMGERIVEAVMGTGVVADVVGGSGSGSVGEAALLRVPLGSELARAMEKKAKELEEVVAALKGIWESTDFPEGE